MTERIPFSKARVGERITFDNGYYMTGRIVGDFGVHDGMRMVNFQREGCSGPWVLKYAAHRSVRRA